LLAHRTPLDGEDFRLNRCPGSVDHYNRVQAMKKNTEDKQSELQARLQELEQKAVGNGFTCH